MNQNVVGTWNASRFSSGRSGVNKHHTEPRKLTAEVKPNEPCRMNVRSAFLQSEAKRYFIELSSQVNWRLVEEAGDPRAAFVAQLQMSAVACPNIKMVSAHKCGEDVCVLLEFTVAGKATTAMYNGQLWEYRLFLPKLPAVGVPV